MHYKLIIDGESYENMVAVSVIKKLGLKMDISNRTTLVGFTKYIARQIIMTCLVKIF